MKEKLFSTSNSWEGLVLRVFAASVMFPHGAQKLLGWFGGFGFGSTMDYFTDTMHLPWGIAFLVIMIEFFGSLLLIAGVATRLVSIAFIVLLLGIIFTSHLQNGFFMNWAGGQTGEGIEYFLLFLGICIALLFTGGGKFSVDKVLLKD